MNSFNLRISITILLSFSLVFNGVLAGLEDAQHSTKLDPSNFDTQTQVPTVGTLTAFFAPWCGHCKTLKTPWDLVAERFKSDPRCRVAHFDADANRDFAARYSVQGFPTIKFLFSDKSKAPINYESERSADVILDFLNKECGTFKTLKGQLLPEAGRVAILDELAKSFLGLPSAERPSVIEKATKLASSTSEALAHYYIKAMNKLSNDEAWLTKEIGRLQKLADQGAAMAVDKLEELQMKQNILQAFIGTNEAAEPVVDKATGEL